MYKDIIHFKYKLLSIIGTRQNKFNKNVIQIFTVINFDR